MAWPDETAIKSQWDALAYYADHALDPFITDAIARVVGVMAQKYDVSGWDDATPPMAAKWVKQLTYSYAQTKPHTGAAEEGGDSLAKTLRDQVEAEMKEVLAGAPLLDDDQQPIPINPAPSNPSTGISTVLLRTLRPVHTMDPPERSRILPPTVPRITSTSRWR